MLEVDNRVIVPELTHIRFIVTGADVIHSYACPALGIKCDAYPGRLNQVSVLINREGVFMVNVQSFVEFFIVLCLL
jgi:cytochrome c oxidase subunit 2